MFFRDFDQKQWNGSYFMIGQFYRQRRFTDRIQTRAYTLDDVFSAFGGFVGLFLGYTIVQIPDTAKSTIEYIQEKCCGRKTKDNDALTEGH